MPLLLLTYIAPSAAYFYLPLTAAHFCFHKVDGSEICGHKLILYLRSDYFKKMVAVRMKEHTSNEIEIKECRLPVFEIVLRFLYGGQVDLCVDTAQEVLMAAERFQIVELKRLSSLTLPMHSICAHSHITRTRRR
jgi:hypothetical protein